MAEVDAIPTGNPNADPSTPFIDATAAGPPIAAPGTPELADVDETLAGAPNAMPAAPVGAVVTPPPPVPGNVTEAGAGAFNAAQEGAAAATDKAQQGLAIDDVEKQRLAQAQQDEDDARVQRQLEAQSQLDARNDFLAKKDAADEKVRDFKFHDYFEDPKHGSKALARFAVFLGGLGNLGGQAPGSPNRALDALETNIKADHDEQLTYLNSAKYFAEKQAEGVQDLAKQQAVDRQQLELDYANKKLATADKFAELAQTARGKSNYDAAMIEVAKLKKSAYDDQQKVFDEIARQKLEDARAQHQLRLAARGRGGAGGGAGVADAFSQFEAAAQAIPPGAPVPKEVYALAFKAGIKRDKIQDQIDKARESGKKSLPQGAGKNPGGYDPNLVVRNGQGAEVGLASSTRTVKQIEDRLVQYDDSIKSLEDLKTYIKSHPLAGHLPTGDAYNRAVLAVAATTTANASDATTKHEANTLKNLGVVSVDAVDKTLEHQKDRQKAFLKQLRPIPAKQGEEAAASPQAKQVLDKLAALGFQ